MYVWDNKTNWKYSIVLFDKKLRIKILTRLQKNVDGLLLLLLSFLSWSFLFYEFCVRQNIALLQIVFLFFISSSDWLFVLNYNLLIHRKQNILLNPKSICKFFVTKCLKLGRNKKTQFCNICRLCNVYMVLHACKKIIF